MLRINHVYKIYQLKKSSNTALNDVSISFPKKGLFVIKGKNGSGKSTLLNILGGMDNPTRGDVFYNSQKVSAKNIDEYRTNNISFLFQNVNLVSSLTIEDNIKVAFELCDKPLLKNSIRNLLYPIFNFDNESDFNCFIKKYPNQLSGGEKKKISIVRCLIKSPKILILDEPEESLDESGIKWLVEFVQKISKTILVIIATHSDNLYKDNNGIVFLEKGKVISDLSLCEKDECLNKTIEIKPKLSFKNIFSFIFGTIKHIKGRLFVFCTLTVTSLSFFGLFLNILFVDANKASLSTLYFENSSYVFIDSYTRNDKSIDKKLGNLNDFSPTFFSDEQLQILHNYNYCFTHSAPTVNCLKEHVIEYWNTNTTAYFMNYINLVNIKTFNGLMFSEFEPIQSESDIINRFPSNYNEIALTDFVAEFFFKHAEDFYTQGFDEIKTINDFIGKTISIGKDDAFLIKDKLVVGIFKTDDPYLNYWKDNDYFFASNPNNIVDLIRSYIKNGNSIIKSIFTFEDDTGHNCKAIVKLKHDLRKDLTILNNLTVSKDRYVIMEHRYSGITQWFETIKPYLVALIGALVLLFALISMMAMFSLIANITSKISADLAIFKSLGANNNTIGKISISFAFIILGICFIVSSCLIVSLSLILGYAIGIKFILLNWATYIVLLFLLFVSTFAYSFFMQKKFSFKMPYAQINKQS